MKTRSTEALSGEVGNLLGVEASINTKNIHKLYSMFENPYKNNIAAIVREYSSNAWDAHKAIGEEDMLFNVSGYYDITGKSILEIEDFGPGMTHDFMYKEFMSYLESTKEDTNEPIGCYGIGSKSGLSYGTHTVTFKSTVDYEETTYLLYKFQGMPKLSQISTSKVEKKSGVIVQLEILKGDEYKFCEEIVNMLMFFDNANIIWNLPGLLKNTAETLTESVLIRTKEFTINSCTFLSSRGIVLINGPVNYNVDWHRVFKESPTKLEEDALRFILNLKVTIGLNSVIGEVGIPFQREEPDYSWNNIQILRKKATEFVNKFKTWIVRYGSVVMDDTPETWKRIFEDSSASSLGKAKVLNHSILGRVPIASIYQDLKYASYKISGNLSWIKEKNLIKSVSTIKNRFSSGDLYINTDPTTKAITSIGYKENNSTIVSYSRCRASEVSKEKVLLNPAFKYQSDWVKMILLNIEGKSLNQKLDAFSLFDHRDNKEDALKILTTLLFVLKRFIECRNYHVIDIKSIIGRNTLPKGIDAQIAAFYSEQGVSAEMTGKLIAGNQLITSPKSLHDIVEEGEYKVSFSIRENKKDKFGEVNYQSFIPIEINDVFLDSIVTSFYKLKQRFTESNFPIDKKILLVGYSDASEARQMTKDLRNTLESSPTMDEVIALPKSVLNYLITQDKLDEQVFTTLYAIKGDKRSLLLRLVNTISTDWSTDIKYKFASVPSVLGEPDEDAFEFISPEMKDYLDVIKNDESFSRSVVPFLLTNLSKEDITILRKWIKWKIRTAREYKGVSINSIDPYNILSFINDFCFPVNPKALNHYKFNRKLDCIKNTKSFISLLKHYVR